MYKKTTKGKQVKIKSYIYIPNKMKYEAKTMERQ